MEKSEAVTKQLIKMYKISLYDLKTKIKREKSIISSIFYGHYFNLPPVTKKILISNKTSETLFILGSGASICEYTPKMWRQIESNDSIGFNFWILHEFVPTFYVAEFYKTKGKEALKVKTLLNNLLAVKNRYTSCLKLFKSPISNNQYKELKAIGGYTALSYWIRAETSGELSKKLQKSISKQHLYPVFYYQTATLDWIIYFSIVLQYKEIVLCGVDLNNSEYFYEKNPKSIESRGLIIPDNLHKEKHKTNDPKQNKGILISDVIKAYQNTNMEHLPKIHIASDKSGLYPQLPLYQWNQ